MESFTYFHHRIEQVNRNDYQFHDHDFFEIYWFLDGDVEYLVEGSSFQLKPYEMVVVPPRMMHRALHKDTSVYERIVCFMQPEFFTQYYCESYLSELQQVPIRLTAEQVFSSGLTGLLERLRQYTNHFAKTDRSVWLSFILELLCILHQIGEEKALVCKDTPVQRIISHLNQHMEKPISLEQLAKNMYLSKEHLCRSFKKATGYTIVSYLNHIRINRVRELALQGMTLNEASIQAGFSNYAHFYKAFYKENGLSPRQGLYRKEEMKPGINKTI